MSTKNKLAMLAFSTMALIAESEPHQSYFPKLKSSVRVPFKRNTARQGPKVGRNDNCPCGSGKKNKHCCKLN